MSFEIPSIVQTAEAGLAAQEAELASARARQLSSTVSLTASGSGDIDEPFALDRRFRLVFVRCHFTGTAGTARMTLAVDSADGSAYDTRLFAISQAGVGRDVHLRITDGDLIEPSPWTFRPGDQVRAKWTSPDSGQIIWGLEVGLALAS